VISFLQTNDDWRVPVEWNETATDYPRDTPVHRLFEEQATLAPGSVAIRCGQHVLTYGELNERANQVAHHLRRWRVGRGAYVGLCMERSPELFAAMLGILKAGGAYVPLDPDYPADRLAFMLQETAAPLVVSHRPCTHRIASLLVQNRLVCLDRDAAAIGRETRSNPEDGATADDLAYVMFTSGSTGTPKGVLIGHRAVVRLVRNTNYCRFGRGEVFLQLAPISFDASTFEIWGALLNGALLAAMPPGPPSLEDLGAAIRRFGVTTLWLTAGLFHLMVEQRVDDLASLRQLLAGGDVLSPCHVHKALEALRDGTLINGYGPTESTTFACCHRMTRGHASEASIPIGRPISNTTVFILDERLHPVPVGEPGELCIGGDGLAHGYLNDPELTRARFPFKPSSGEQGTRIYRTGDRARYRPDGVIEFLGRLDSQVKISGHRVEPAEIEAKLQRHPAIRQAAVVSYTGLPPRGQKRLVAYFVGTQPGRTATEELRDYLASLLPSFMIPAVFLELAQLPLSPNGKVDRSALPPPPRHPHPHPHSQPHPNDTRREAPRALRP
jgi:amino acid adenylation domain-containing protein